MRPFPPETKKPTLVPQNRSCNCSNTHAIIYKMMKVFKGLVSLFMRRFCAAEGVPGTVNLV